LKSPPHSFFKHNFSRHNLSENGSPNHSYGESSLSSIGATPQFPSPALSTPFFKRAAGTFDVEESFEIVVAETDRKRMATPGFRQKNDDFDALPPTPECAELPRSVKIIRHRMHFAHSDSPEPSPVLLQCEGSDHDMDDSLGATPGLSSPPASVVLMQQKKESAASTPVSGAHQLALPGSAFDPKYQKGFEREVLGQLQRPDESQDGEELYDLNVSLVQEESWLVSDTECSPTTPMTDVMCNNDLRAAELERVQAAHEQKAREQEEEEKQRSAVLEEENKKRFKAEEQKVMKEQKVAEERKQKYEELKKIEEAEQKRTFLEAEKKRVDEEAKKKKQLEQQEQLRLVEEAKKLEERRLEERYREQEVRAAELKRQRAAHQMKESEKRESERKAEEEARSRFQQESRMVQQIAVPASIAEKSGPVRWVPKPEETREFSRPTPVAAKPIFVRPAALAVVAARPFVPAVPRVVAVQRVTTVSATMEWTSEDVSIQDAPTPPPPPRAAPAKIDSKARLKVVYGVFVRSPAALSLEEVLLELGAEWTAQEAEKTLNMLVVLKLLQKTGADRWGIK
jgi:hypothetical protein